ncbi:Hint domain-containing protein [Acidisoma sp. 7E03]
MATNDYTATNSDGVTYALTYHPLLGTYTLVITPPVGGGTPQTVDGIPAANVLTASGGTLAIASALVGSTYVVPPGVVGSIDITVALASLVPNTIYVGGDATISSTVSALSGLSVHIDGGSATVAPGTLAGALSDLTVYLDNGGTFGNGSAVASVLDNTTINYGLGGGTFVANAGGAVLDLSSTTINGFDAASDEIEFVGVSGTVDHYSITTVGSSQQIALYNSNNVALVTADVAGTPFATGTVFQGQSGPLTVDESGSTITVNAAASVFTCFLAGTRITTPTGEVEIELLRSGDLVMTPDGRSVAVRWVGANSVSTAFSDRDQVMPVRIQKGAFSSNVPARDLFVSPDHSFYFDGGLVPARLLVNGTTICQVDCGKRLVYYHIELEPHDLVLAEGAPTESFLDLGSQRKISVDGVVQLHRTEEPKSWEDSCAPLVLTGPALDRVRRLLSERARSIETLESAA